MDLYNKMTYETKKRLVNKYNFFFQGDDLISLALMVVNAMEILDNNDALDLLEKLQTKWFAKNAKKIAKLFTMIARQKNGDARNIQNI